MKGGRTVEHKTNERNKGEYWEEKGLSRGGRDRDSQNI